MCGPSLFEADPRRSNFEQRNECSLTKSQILFPKMTRKVHFNKKCTIKIQFAVSLDTETTVGIETRSSATHN